MEKTVCRDCLGTGHNLDNQAGGYVCEWCGGTGLTGDPNRIDKMGRPAPPTTYVGDIQRRRNGSIVRVKRSRLGGRA